MLVGDFVRKLKETGFDYFVGVPCSFFKSTINYVIDDQDVEYHMAVNEGAALAMASGAYLAGRLPVVILQNSGFGNLVNPLTSLSMIYNIPVLLLVSGRHYKVKDEPQHTIMGNRMESILEGFGLKNDVLPTASEKIMEYIESAKRFMETEKQPLVYIVQKGTFSDYNLTSVSDMSVKTPLITRYRALEIVSQYFGAKDAVVSTTGKISRLLYVINDQHRNFYMMGSMGHAISIGLGIALNQPERKVIVLDGDGAALMHMGAQSTVGYYKPSNLIHIVLDNEAHESTGGQFTTSGTTDLTGVAKSCGYRTALEVINEKELTSALDSIIADLEGPAFINIKVDRMESIESIPRITEKHSTAEISDNFRDFLENE